MHGKVYRSYHARPRMTRTDWAIALAMGAPFALLLALTALITLLR